MSILDGLFGPSRKELKIRSEKLEEKNVELQNEISYVIGSVRDLESAASAVPFIPENSIILPQYRYTPFNGEKNDGALGPILNLAPDYYAFAQRAWTMYMTSDIAKTIIDKYIVWIISQGLNLKSNPVKDVLESEGIKMDKSASEKFNDIVEARFGVWSKSVQSSFSGEKNLKQLAKECLLNAKIGGDVLVVLRYINGAVKVQLIDGRRIITPAVKQEIPEENFVFNGIEMTPEGKHVNYWLRGKDGLSKAVPAYSKTGLRSAFVVKGSGWTLDFHRGLPIIAVVMESIGKLDRYKEAIVGNAEEISKLVYQITHGRSSDGSDPFSAKGVIQRFQKQGSQQTLPVDEFDEQLARKVTASFGKQTVNMSKDSKLEPVQPSTTIREFEQFYKTNAHIVCAAVGIPPNVAFSLYTDSYSASRAATKDWDHKIDVERDDFTDQFYMHIYKFWLFSEIMSGTVDAPGFVQAFTKKNFMVTDSYTNARFTGPHFPHVDPVTEVKAERLKLGTKGDTINLTTVEQAVEALGCGDSDSNMEQFSDELNIADGLGLIDKEVVPVVNNADETK